jgi:ribosome-binding protein aMBF1 (putative translation factor)
VIKKLERYLDIELMIERTPDEQQQVGTGTSRPMTLGDYIQDALRKE